MGRFCENCGAELYDKALFCRECGRKIADQSHSAGSLSANDMPGYVGFSERINDPEVIKEIEERDKRTRLYFYRYSAAVSHSPDRQPCFR